MRQSEPPRLQVCMEGSSPARILSPFALSLRGNGSSLPLLHSLLPASALVAFEKGSLTRSSRVDWKQKRGQRREEEDEKEETRSQALSVLQQARGRGSWWLLSALSCNIPSLLCLCFAFYQHHWQILLSLSVGLLILPSDLWVAATLYIPAPSHLLQTQTPYLIRFSPWLRQTEIELQVYLYCSGAHI